MSQEEDQITALKQEIAELRRDLMDLGERHNLLYKMVKDRTGVGANIPGISLVGAVCNTGLDRWGKSPFQKDNIKFPTKRDASKHF